jgi:hypothetical protein
VIIYIAATRKIKETRLPLPPESIVSAAPPMPRRRRSPPSAHARRIRLAPPHVALPPPAQGRGRGGARLASAAARGGGEGSSAASTAAPARSVGARPRLGSGAGSSRRRGGTCLPQPHLATTGAPPPRCLDSHRPAPPPRLRHRLDIAIAAIAEREGEKRWTGRRRSSWPGSRARPRL